MPVTIITTRTRQLPGDQVSPSKGENNGTYLREQFRDALLFGGMSSIANDLELDALTPSFLEVVGGASLNRLSICAALLKLRDMSRSHSRDRPYRTGPGRLYKADAVFPCQHSQPKIPLHLANLGFLDEVSVFGEEALTFSSPRKGCPTLLLK